MTDGGKSTDFILIHISYFSKVNSLGFLISTPNCDVLKENGIKLIEVYLNSLG